MPRKWQKRLREAFVVMLAWPLYQGLAFGQLAAQAADASKGNLRNPQALRYAVHDGAIIGRNGSFYNNRPLYCPHVSAAVLGGDRPILDAIARGDGLEAQETIIQVHNRTANLLLKG